MKKTTLFFAPLLIAASILGYSSFSSNALASSYPDDSLLTSPEHSSVYQIVNGKRSPFVNSDVYFTWHDDFSNVQEISVAELESIELGNPMPVRPNTKLIKFPLNPRVYAVTDDNFIQHIPNEQTALSLFGPDWNSNIIELPEIYYLFYMKGASLDSVSQNSSTTSELPVISNVNIAPYPNRAVVSWDTNVPTTGSVEYGLNRVFADGILYGTVASGNQALDTSHTIELPDLSAETIHELRIVSTNAAGESVYSENFSFTTLESTQSSDARVPDVGIPPRCSSDSQCGEGLICNTPPSGGVTGGVCALPCGPNANGASCTAPSSCFWTWDDPRGSQYDIWSCSTPN